MIRKIIYGVCALAVSLFLIWLNIGAVKIFLSSKNHNSDLMAMPLTLFIFEGLIIISLLIAAIVILWERLWDYIDKKDEQIKTYFENKKRVSKDGSLSVSENIKNGWLSK
jgi:hypothetical protein